MIDKHVSVFGASGFIGYHWMFRNPLNTPSSQMTSVEIPRESDCPSKWSSDVLYLISTTDNYNVFENPHLDINTNLIKLVSVLEGCRKKEAERKELGFARTSIVFNFVSSWFVYGLNSSLNTVETDYCDPTGFYSITKRAAEQLIISYCETHGMKYRIFRLTNTIGRGDKGASKKKNYLQHMISMLKNNENISLYDEGSNIRDYMYVKDVCEAIRTCILYAPENEIINISNNNQDQMKDLALYCKEKLGSSSTIEYIDTPHFHNVVQVKDVSLNNKKLVSYGYNDSRTAYDALDLILEHERANK